MKNYESNYSNLRAKTDTTEMLVDSYSINYKFMWLGDLTLLLFSSFLSSMLSKKYRYDLSQAAAVSSKLQWLV